MIANCPAFDRPVVALLGVPIDAINMEKAVARLETARRLSTRCFMSTPNLNFAIQSQQDANFRDSVCRSDLSLADGMPLVWLSICMGLPIRERLSGSSLFEILRKAQSKPWRVFFLGGPKGVAQQACLSLAKDEASMTPVGLIDPGFIDVKNMNRQDIVDCINEAKPDMLVVALGAQKGQAWISDHLTQLQVPVVSHLGAVVNFVAGTVSRAPMWVQKLGMEWLWRIKEEPYLWRRYWLDAHGLLRIGFHQVLPLVLTKLLRQLKVSCFGIKPCVVLESLNELAFCLTLQGDCVVSTLRPVRDAFTIAWHSGKYVEVNCSDVTYFDAHFVALLLLLDTGLRDVGRRLSLTGLSSAQVRVFHLHAAGHLLT
jgi:N-acetylglucosaminyldiphosphoundecaprenol N-acetyl-beta-D-mannosaminyltransferase